MFKFIGCMIYFSLFFVLLNCCHVSSGLAADCAEQFSWLPNTETDIDGYKLYYGTSNGGPYPNAVDIDNPMAAADGRVYGEISGLTCGTTYYAVCVAYNNQDVESNYSSQVTFTPPNPDGSSNITRIFGDSDKADYHGTIVDTFINVNENNSVSSATLNTYTWPENKVANAILLKIDLSQIPANAQIQSATLQLYQSDAGGDADYSLTVHKIINHNPDLSLSTGFVYASGSQWTSNTKCYNNIPMAQADIATAEDTVTSNQTSGYKSWNITEMVSEWVSNPATNFGLLVNSDSMASANSFRTFASSEAADAGQRPIVTIVYSNPTDKLQPPASFFLHLD